jgi:hypothetical protein
MGISLMLVEIKLAAPTAMAAAVLVMLAVGLLYHSLFNDTL